LRKLHWKCIVIVTLTALTAGLGTTTAAVHLARILNDWRPTILVDATEDLAATTWNRKRRVKEVENDLVVLRLTGQDLATELAHLQERFENIVVDAGGSSMESQEAVIRSSDRMVYSTSFDEKSLQSVRMLLVQTSVPRARYPRIVSRALFTNVIVRSNSIAPRFAKRFLNDQCGLLAFDNVFSKRKAFAEAIDEGRTVRDDTYTEQGYREVDALADATLSMILPVREPSGSVRSQSPRHCRGSFAFSPTSQVPALVQNRFSD
jgi:cellulose biosynthesis protein BcsQ